MALFSLAEGLLFRPVKLPIDYMYQGNSETLSFYISFHNYSRSRILPFSTYPSLIT